MFFAFGKPDTVVLGASEAYVTEALGAGKKIGDNAELAGFIALADQKAPIWGAGKVDPRVRDGLLRVTQGKVASGPQGQMFSLDLTDGAKVSAGVVMASPADARSWN